MTGRKIFLLGVGNVGKAIATRLDAKRRNGSIQIIGTTRNPNRIFEFVDRGWTPIIMPWPSAEVIESIAEDADVVVTFPPDGTTDAILAPGCKAARSLVYISSTGVYGKYSGTINDTTPVDKENHAAAPRLEAEEIWREQGAIVLRAPAIYGPDMGLHLRLKNGDYSIPGDGTNMVSRIHVDDLVSLILACFERGKTGETFVVGDRQPASHQEVTAWLCDRLNLPLPPHSPLEDVSAQLRGNRVIDASRVWHQLGVEMQYPSYKEGFEAFL